MSVKRFVRLAAMVVFLVRYKTAREVTEVRTGRRALLFRSILCWHICLGRVRPTFVFCFADTVTDNSADRAVGTLASALAGAGLLTSGIGCPTRGSRPSKEQHHGLRQVKDATGIAEEKNAPSSPLGNSGFVTGVSLVRP